MAEEIKEILLGELHPFPDHPFGVRDDEAMEQTVESILLSPLNGTSQENLSRPTAM